MNTRHNSIHAIESAILGRLRRADRDLDLASLQRSILGGNVAPETVRTALNRLRKQRLIARTFIVKACGEFDTVYRYDFEHSRRA